MKIPSVHELQIFLIILSEIQSIGEVRIMSLLDVILSRRSIRKYENKEIPKEILQQILEAGGQALSAVNRQPIRFVVVTHQNILKDLCDTIITLFVKEAPAVIVGCADVKSLMTGKWAVVDTTIAMENMVIAAWALDRFMLDRSM